MTDDRGSKARARRQERVAKLVWGTLFLVMGVLFTLDDMGRIDLGNARREFAAAHAVDGDPSTRWASAFEDPQWLAVDLGAAVPVGRIRVHWEAAHAKDYELQVSSDGASWATAHRVRGGEGGIEEHELAATARHVRLLGSRRATPYGYSLWELQVFGPDGRLVSRGKPVQASSLEDVSLFALWMRFWPLLFIAAGLPLVLVPRDDTSQVVGIVLTATGTFVQLGTLGVIPWGFRETSSAVLIVVGLVILLQARRRSETSENGDAAPGGGLS